MLDNQTLIENIRKAKKGDEVAKELVFSSNLPLIKCLVRRFVGKGIEYDDLYQIACIGFLKAVKNFDESFGVKFSTYTVPMVIGEIKRFIRDNGAIKVSRNLKILANKINKFIDEYQYKNINSPSIELIANHFNVSPDDVVVALDSVKMPLSIFDNFEDDEEGLELIDKIGGEDEEEKVVDRIQLFDNIKNLSSREQKIIFLRYFRDKTQSEIAKGLGVSQVQISRLENKIIEKIRQSF